MAQRRGILELFGFRVTRIKPHFKRGKVNYEKLLKVIEDNVRRRKLYLDRNYSIAMLANDVDSNRTYVSRALKSRGMTFSAYINSFRLQYAISLMSMEENDSLSVERIASMSGFASERTMNYYLVKTVGVSASLFRTRMKDFPIKHKGNPIGSPLLKYAEENTRVQP